MAQSIYTVVLCLVNLIIRFTRQSYTFQLPGQLGCTTWRDIISFMLRLRDRATTHRFFACPPWPLKLLTIYVWGDALVIVPLWIAIVVVLAMNLQFGLIAICILYAVRGLGEMIYWIHQQFGSHAYRPYDFGFKYLDNHAVYILYQLLATAQMMMALGALAYLVLNH